MNADLDWTDSESVERFIRDGGSPEAAAKNFLIAVANDCTADEVYAAGIRRGLEPDETRLMCNLTAADSHEAFVLVARIITGEKGCQ